MADRRKIIIETGGEADEQLSTPHFDTEATLTARPVVPLSDQEPYQTRYNEYGGSAARPFWKRPALLVLVVLVAVGVGVAAGIAIGFYRSRGTAQNPVAAAPSSTAESATPSSTVEIIDPGKEVETPEPESTSQARAAVPEETEEPIVEPKDEARERTARNERRERDDDDEAKPPVVRDKKPVKVDEYIIEEGREAERERRREERRAERRERRRRQREEESNLPRQVERAGREIDRIRDIFEGRQP